VTVPNAGTFGPATRSCRFEVPIWRIRNARQSTAASHSAQVVTHQQESLSAVIVSNQGVFEVSS
jgi:hypothetical protein